MAIADPTVAPSRSRKRRQRPVPQATAPAPADLARRQLQRRRKHRVTSPKAVPRDARGHRRTPQTTAEFHAGRAPRNKGKSYPRNPPSIWDSVRFIAGCEDTPTGRRRRAIYILLWRTGMRCNEARHLLPSDFNEAEGTIVVRHGKGTNGSGPRARIVVMDAFGWQMLRPWLDERDQYPAGPLFCVLNGPTAGIRAWAYCDINREFHKHAQRVGIDKRLTPHQLRHALAAEWDRGKVDIATLQKQLGHWSRHQTYKYVGELTLEDLVEAGRQIRAPMLPVNDVMTMLMTLTLATGDAAALAQISEPRKT